MATSSGRLLRKTPITRSRGVAPFPRAPTRAGFWATMDAITGPSLFGANEQTQNLIDKATQSGTAADKRLVVDISTQALQANLSAGEGFDAVWSASSGLKVGADGALVRK